MRGQNCNNVVFFALIRAGLWGCSNDDLILDLNKGVDWNEVYQLAQEQSVLGLLLQGIEEVKAKGIELSVPKTMLLQWIGEVQMIEQRNKEMNAFVADIIEKLRKGYVYAILVKGQGIAQCYEKPLWRSCGDIDLLLSGDNYIKAKSILASFASSVEEENIKAQHLGLVMLNWIVELHGTLRSCCLPRMDKVIDDVVNDVFWGGNNRIWENKSANIPLPSPDNDVFLIFTHILKHFFYGGIGIRQICDWCRLLYTYNESLNHKLLVSRLLKAGIMTEWKAFGAFAVEYLGIPKETMPFLDVRGKMDDGICKIDKRLKRKADRILEFVMESGNFGKNRDISYKQKYPFIIRYAMSFWLYTKLAIQRFSISQKNDIMAWWAIVKMGANAAAKNI